MEPISSRQIQVVALPALRCAGSSRQFLSAIQKLAASNAQMGLPEVRHNVVAMGGGLFRLPQRIPYHVAMELALSGEFKDAAFFERHGLINRVVEPGGALDEAVALANSLLVNGPTALAASRRSSSIPPTGPTRKAAALVTA